MVLKFIYLFKVNKVNLCILKIIIAFFTILNILKTKTFVF